MSVNGVNGVESAYSTGNTNNYNPIKQIKPQEETVSTRTGQTAVVYEKTDKVTGAAEETVKTKTDKARITQMLREAEQKKASFRAMVEKMFTKQGETAATAALATTGLAEFYRGLEVPTEVSEAAKKEIADDGYWGIEQTSDRILSFAQAVAGTDKEMAGKMLEAVKEGFKQAKDAWGEELPDISQKTMDKSLEKINAWIEGLDA